MRTPVLNPECPDPRAARFHQPQQGDPMRPANDPRIPQLYAHATWATLRARSPQPGDFVSPDELRQFARNCRERIREIELGRA